MKNTILATLLMTPLCVIAEPVSTKQAGEWDFGIGLGTTAIDSEAAAEVFVEDSAFAFDLYADYSQSHWLTTVGLGILAYDDQKQFSARVRNSFTDRESTEDSSATGILIHGAFGRFWPYSQNDSVRFYAQGGVAVMLSSERSIDRCDNCPEEDIDLNGGVFGKAGVSYSFDNIAIGAAYTQYLSGDLNNTLMLNLSTPF